MSRYGRRGAGENFCSRVKNRCLSLTETCDFDRYFLPNSFCRLGDADKKVVAVEKTMAEMKATAVEASGLLCLAIPAS